MSAEKSLYRSAVEAIERSRRLRAELAALQQETLETIAQAKEAIVSLFAAAREVRRHQEAWRDLRRRGCAMTGEKIVDLSAWRTRHRRRRRRPLTVADGVAGQQPDRPATQR